jgi:hypothetical protein
MKQQTINIIKQQGYSPIFEAIHKSIRDFKQLQYSLPEIKETLLDCFGVDDKTIQFISRVTY